MFAVLSTISPIFILIGLGYLGVKVRWVAQEHVPSMGRFVLFFCLPALIFSTLATTDVRAVLEPWYLVAYGVGSGLAFWLGFAATRWLARGTATEAGLNGLGMSLSNSAFVGYPVLLQVFGTLPAAAFSMTLLVENLLIMPTALIVLELTKSLGEAGHWRTLTRTFLRRLFSQPVLIAILAGTAFSLTGWSLPDPMMRSLDLLANASAGVALFVIGGSLVGTRLKGERRRIGAVTLGKLGVHPVLVAGAVWLVPAFDPTLQRIAVLAAAMPMLGIYPVFAAQYREPRRYASILVVATLASFVSISVVLAVVF